MNARQCPDDLLVAARSRALSDLERQVLSAHLARCELCRAGELAADLLGAPLLSAGGTPDADRALVERVAERVSASLARSARHTRSTWRRAAAAVAVFLGLGGVASAWIGRSFVAAPPAVRAPAPTGSDAAPRGHRGARTLAPPVAPPSPSRPPAPAKKPVAARPIPDGAGPATQPETAGSLFAEAAQARHEGDLHRAVGLYGTLRAAFPESDQSHIASISMGDLLLRLDEPARALRAFDAYLAEVRTGALREEALYGRARSLKKLGDETAEKETWARLVRDFPGSAYGPGARQRLEELRSDR